MTNKRYPSVEKARPNKRLIRAREALHLTQVELAEHIGVRPLTVSRWENGQAFPVPHHRQMLCDFFHMSDEELGFVEKYQEDIAEDAPRVIWNVPYRQNPYFTGREPVLQRIHATLHSGKTTALTQAQAISGLGGIGKTQVAIEYAYLYSGEYKAVLWVRADSRTSIISDFIAIAQLLGLQMKDEQDQSLIVAAVKRWLKQHGDWLLILDNADNIEVVTDFIDPKSKGHVLLTTRSQNTGTIAYRIDIKKWVPEVGARFLLRRAEIVGADMPLDTASKTDRKLAMEIAEILDGLPLALDQAGAYIRETACGLDGYLRRYRNHRARLLEQRGNLVTAYPESVATAWSISFEQVQGSSAAAADLLQFCAFLHPDAIPEEIVFQGAPDLGPTLETLIDDITLDVPVSVLRRYSLIDRHADTKTLTMHRLVQAVLVDRMNEDTRHKWVESTVRAVNRAFPEVEFPEWESCQRCLAHALVCVGYIEQYNMMFPEAARLLHQAGSYLVERARYAEAEPLLQRALAIRAKILGPEHPSTAASLNDLADLYRTRGKYSEAEPLFLRVLAIWVKTLGPEHPTMAASLNDLARLYWDQGEFKQAEPLLQRALAIREQVLGPKHPDTADNLDNLAGVYRFQGEFEQAELLQQRALVIREQVLGPKHPDTATSLDNLAGLYQDQGKFKQAEPLMQRALAIREQALGPEHAITGVSLNNLAGLYRAQNKYEQAESLQQAALAISEKILGLEHPSVATDLNNLAGLYQEQGKYLQAQGKRVQAQDSYALAEPLYQRALKIQSKALGPAHPDTARSLNNLGALYQEQGKFKQAEPLLQSALTTRERVLGPSHPDTATSLNNLARLYVAQGLYEQAETFFQRALAIREKALGPEHSDTVTCLDNYTTLLRKLEREDQASELEAHFGLSRAEQAQGRSST